MQSKCSPPPSLSLSLSLSLLLFLCYCVYRQCTSPKLVSFRGRSKDFSPRARIRSWLGYAPQLLAMKINLQLCFCDCVGMNCRLTAMTGLWIGVDEGSATSLTTMAVSLQPITLLPSTLTCVQPSTLSLLCGTEPGQLGGGGPLRHTAHTQ